VINVRADGMKENEEFRISAVVVVASQIDYSLDECVGNSCSGLSGHETLKLCHFLSLSVSSTIHCFLLILLET
jgi:hypothetical protein